MDRSELEQMSSEQLAQMLRQETEKEEPDDDLVLQILHTLEKRKQENSPALGERGQAAWNYYKAKRARGYKHFIRAMRVAFLAVFMCLLFTQIPHQATAGIVWKFLTHWTEDFFEYVNTSASTKEPEPYVFHSENPGLQEVYDAVTEELGVTEPIVPQWLPEGYELVEFKKNDLPSDRDVYARFLLGDAEFVLSYREMTADLLPQYEKSGIKPREYETNGVIHNYMWDSCKWVVCWSRQNIKCMIVINCPEEDLQRIIKSIYEIDPYNENPSRPWEGSFILDTPPGWR